VRQGGAVFLVFALLVALLWSSRRGKGGLAALRTFSHTRPSGSLTLVEHVALTPQHVLHRVRAGDRDLLLVTHPQGCTIMDEQARLQQPTQSQSTGI
jgi:hypothetical protein